MELVERAERIVEYLRLNSYCCEFLRPLTIHFHALLLTALGKILLNHSSDPNMSDSVPSIQSEPDALPPSVEGRMVWQGNQLEPNQYITNLERADVEAVRAAVLFFKCKSLLA